MTKRRTLLREVAEAAGVSKFTASVALNDRPGVGPSLRRRIKRIARRMGYRPNPFVRHLRECSSRMIGLYTQASPAGYDFSRTLASINTTLREQGYSAALIMDNPMPEGSPRGPVPELIRDGYLDGLIGFEHIPRSILTEAKHHAMPCVQVFSDPEVVPGVRVITEDPIQSVAAAVRHLVALGHRWIAGLYVGHVRPGHESKVNDPAYPWTRGFAAGMAGAGLEAIRPEVPTADADRWLAEARRGGDVTAVVVQDVSSAIELGKALTQVNISVPTDVSVISTNCNGVAIERRSLYTFINTDYERIGRLAAESLMSYLAGDIGADWQATILTAPVGVIDLGTTAPPSSRREAWVREGGRAWMV